jgi:gamma-glutamylcyclotransferase (GGCT)/AIG2-like uncharacterized protein YtfP
VSAPLPAPPLPLFVYGTLRPGLRNHARHLAGRCLAARPAVLPGAALHEGPGYPFAVLDATPGRAVRGELLTVRPDLFAGTLDELDELEDCRPDGTGLYVRLRLPVLLTGPHGAAGGTVPAWVYLAGPEQTARLRVRPALIPTGDWTDRDS